MNNYYVYAFLREDGTPYYIGKGKGSRAYSNGGRPINRPKNKKNIVILENSLDEKTAFTKENEYILKYGRIDIETGILRNKTNGGEGSSGVVYSEEYKINMSNIIKKLYATNQITPYWKNKKHSEEHRKKNSEANSGHKNPMFGKKQKEETKTMIREKRLSYMLQKGIAFEYHIENIKTNETFVVNSLKQFCIANNLNRGALAKTFLGRSKNGKKYTQHKTFKIVKKDQLQCV